ncbi:MAG: molybdopterin molybdotransferase MoeA [Gemmatimonadota bacterium]
MEFPSSKADWLTVREALDRILAGAAPLDPVPVPLMDAVGRVLAEDVTAAVDLPPWDNSAMDGYAVLGAELETMPPGGLALPVDGEVRAGAPPRDAPPPGHAVRIMTGAPVPPPLDTVIRVEDTDGESGRPGTVVIHSARDRGRHIRPGGQDMRRGDLLLSAGAPLTPGRIGVLASAGRDPVAVHPPPRVTILPTGDELRVPADFADVEAGLAIPESNGPVLSAVCRQLGLPSTLLPPAPDDDRALHEALDRAMEGDVLVTLGGASMGTADRVKSVLAERDFRLDFWRVLMRPGSPFSFGTLPRNQGAPPLPVFGLPGNPASAFVTFHLLVRPFLLRRAGRRRIHLPVVRARAGHEFPTHPSRTQFVRVILEDGDDRGGTTARRTGPQGSGLVRSVADAHGLAVVPAGADRWPAGTEMTVLRLMAGVEDNIETPDYQDRVDGPA